MNRKLKLISLMSLMILVMLSTFLSTQTKVMAYSGGLLDGKSLRVYQMYDPDPAHFTTTTGSATDGNLNTMYNLGVVNKTNDTLLYTFSEPVTIDSYQLNLKDTNSLAPTTLKFWNGGTAILSIDWPVRNGVKTSISPLLNVTGVSLETTSPSYQAQVYEIDVFGTLPDSIPPSAPTNLKADPSSTKAILTWDAVTDDDLSGYFVYVDGEKQTSSPITDLTYTVTGLTNNVTHYFQVSSVDASGNESAKSSMVTTIFDTISPLAPLGLVSMPQVNGSTLLTWDINTEPDLAGYNVFQDDVKINKSIVIPNEYTVNDLEDNRTYEFKVTALDNSNNESPKSAAVTYYMDSSAPQPPSGLSGTAGTTKVTLTWLAPPDEDLNSYNVYQGGVLIKSNVKDNSFEVEGLTPDTLYNYTVRAVDQSGNESANSNPLSIRTEIKPSNIPNNVTAKAKDQSVTIQWDAVENATAYKIYRNDEELATTSETSYLDENLTNGTVYAYRISAIVDDTESEASNAVHARPGNQLDLEAPNQLSSVLDIVKTAFSFLGKYALYVVLVLGLFFSRWIVGFMIWLFRKMLPSSKEEKQRAAEQRQPKQRQPLSPEEKERRARERKLNKARDDKYELLTRQGRTSERDRWAKEVDYLNREQRQAKAREERNRKAREDRAAAKSSSGGRKSRGGRTSGRSQRTGRTSSRGGRKGGR